ncbi:MAG: hypothetical protein VX733_13440 [Candidatus Latescibacterota bacterium]|nr:hypothetical protein [Candidatus Latescibacterota bacterium]
MSERRPVTTAEVATLLIETVCVSGDSETQALAELADALAVSAELLISEMLFLRAFTVEFALTLTLAEGHGREQVEAHYGQHWERIDHESGEQVVPALEEHLQFYGEIVGEGQASALGLATSVGVAFAQRCGAGDTQELVLLGGRMFGALLEEVSALLTEAEITMVSDS